MPINGVVVVTGASAGVGRATAQRFAAHGARLALIARDASALEETAAEIAALGATAAAFPADVADADAVFAAARDIEERMGPIAVWINDAMATVISPVAEMTPAEFLRVTEVTYLGYVHGTMAALAAMRARDEGVIVQVGSALAYRGIPLQSAYCAAKHAIRGFTDSLRAELLHDKSRIRIAAVHLPAVNTPQFDWARTRMPRAPRPVAPVFTPDVAARAVYAAARRPKREILVGASTIKVVLGNMVAPGYLDQYLARTGYEGQQADAAIEPGRTDNLDAPARGLHRTEGRFAKEARGGALLLSGAVARWGAGLAGLAVALAIGFAAGLIVG